jgi:hypothetical protein
VSGSTDPLNRILGTKLGEVVSSAHLGFTSGCPFNRRLDRPRLDDSVLENRKFS